MSPPLPPPLLVVVAAPVPDELGDPPLPWAAPPAEVPPDGDVDAVVSSFPQALTSARAPPIRAANKVVSGCRCQAMLRLRPP
jgi:hypothetical protein